MIPLSENSKNNNTDISDNPVLRKSNLPMIFLNEARKRIELEGHMYELQMTNLENMYFPVHGFKKRDLIDYYENIADTILPYIFDRPLEVERFPSGIHNKGFFQHEFHEAPPYATLYKYSANYFTNTSYIVCQNKPTLMYLANKAAIEMRPWLSRLTSIQKPDFAVIELIPYNTNFEKVIAVALEINDILVNMEIKPLVKTSGEHSLHIYIPLGNLYSYQQTLNFAKLIALLVHKRMPSITSIENYQEYRKNKVYIDYTQNRSGETVTAPYSVLATHSAIVSTPLSWEEVDIELNPRTFNIKSIPLRLKEKGDVWKNMYKREGINMIEILEQWAF